MKCTAIFAALACVLLALTVASCGAFKGETNSLQSLTLNVSEINGTPVTAAGGIVTLEGMGGTLQLQVIGNYSNGKSVDLSTKATYNVVVDPANDTGPGLPGDVLPPPCQAPNCPVGVPGDYTAGTVEYNSSGLLTAVEPAVCTWVNSNPNGSQPAWAYVGDYIATATYLGLTSQPVYVPVGSAAGVVSLSNPTGACGPTNNS